MRKQLASAVLASLMALFLTACASGPATQADAGPAISAEAKAALAQAEKDVKEAKAKFALWTTAEKALKDAQAAAKNGDSAAVLKQSALASDHVKMGLAQAAYPLTSTK
ncbi:MAG: hypothetical protein HY850_05220 [Betaproteobacteria bacterium]|nr:hypothetical protein [Betaproteobacteria bacterium]